MGVRQRDGGPVTIAPSGGHEVVGVAVAERGAIVATLALTPDGG